MISQKGKSAIIVYDGNDEKLTNNKEHDKINMCGLNNDY